MSDSQTASYEVLAPGGHANLISNIKEYVADATTVKPDYDALAPDFTSGAALSLTSPTATEGTWAQRVTDAVDGVAVVDGILGNTVVWNQVGRFVKWSGEAPKWGSGFNSWSISADGRSASIENGAGTNIIYWSIVPTDHKLYFSICITASGTFGRQVEIGFGGTYVRSGVTLQPNTKARVAMIGTMGTANKSVAIYPNGTSSSVTCDYTLEDFQLFDLTRMFGAGNEPSTVAEFEALFPESYYPYDAGSLLSVNLTGVESADADGNVLQQRSIPAATYFPDGMRSAGTVHDELTADAAIVRVGDVDLGTLTWSYSSDNAYFYVALAGMAIVSSSGTMPDFTCAEYTVVTATSTNGWASKPDKSIGTRHTTSYLCVKDSAYTNTADFKAAVSGVMLHYALATPTTTPIDPPLNLTYRVERGGTESVMHANPTTAPTWRIRYPFDLAGTVMANIAPVEQSVATATHAIGDLLCVGWQLYRVTRAIAIGERIAAGTNVTPTTVAAEIAAIQ